MQTTRGTSLTESTSSAEAGSPAAQSTQPAPAKAAVKPSMRRIALLGAVALTVIIADLLSKIAIVSWMTENETRNVIGRLLQITYTRNAGAAFSFGEGMTVVFALVAVAVAVAIIRTARSLRSLWWAITLGLLLGGALGNLGDRIFRYPGFLRGPRRRLDRAAALAGVQPG